VLSHVPAADAKPLPVLLCCCPLCASNFPSSIPTCLTLETARFVSHTLKECVGYHTSRKILCVVHLNFRKSLTEIPKNGCGTMRAAAVTWQSPISPDGRLAELACTGSPWARLQEHLGGDWRLPRYSRRPHRPTPISRNFIERFSKIHTQFFL